MLAKAFFFGPACCDGRVQADTAMTQAKEHESRTDSNDLQSRFKELKGRQTTLRSRLKELSGLISSSISLIKDLKKKRNALTDSVKTHKDLRSNLSHQIREKIELVKAWKATSPLPSKDQREKNPSWLKVRMDELNLRIEIEALAFEKEKQLMKQIKEFKVAYEKAVKESKASRDIANLSREINEIKAQADRSHNLVQEQARQSQIVHEEIIVLSKKVDTFKREEAQVKRSFIEVKGELDTVSKHLSQLRSITLYQEADHNERVKRQDEDRTKKILSQRIAKVNEKLKSGQKLTTEDLIVLQGEEEITNDK